jgi:acyl CoA:acetate/3-ketoacid CoA transferase beta subunit
VSRAARWRAKPEVTGRLACLFISSAANWRRHGGGQALEIFEPGKAVLHRILTDLAVMDVTPDGLLLLELAPGVSAREVQEKTEAKLVAAPGLAHMPLG